jgi:hypothetical protein
MEERHVAFRMFISVTGTVQRWHRIDWAEHWRPEGAEAV